MLVYGWLAEVTMGGSVVEVFTWRNQKRDR